MSELSWKKLLTPKRQRPTNAPKGHRNAFEQDYDRIVGSSSVRRLQDKAQVFPLQEGDVTRTRLTHSMEVSALARSLGKAVGYRLRKIDSSFPNEEDNDGNDGTDMLAALLQTAGLIHDLGNPPFGHYGETVIRNWFEKYFHDHNSILPTERQKDFLYFDGNVQNLRIVTKLQMLNDQFGANFTFATLATIMKYPWGSSTTPKEGKYGYYSSEENVVKEIWNSTGLSQGVRHPATYLLEAADDIVYICDDIEDGVKKGLIEWENTIKKLKCEFSGDFYHPLFDSYDRYCSKIMVGKQDATFAKVLNFRNATQGFMIQHVVENFITNYQTIMNGGLGILELLDIGEIKPLKVHLKSIAGEHCFNSREVITLELIGHSVINKLLDIFVPAMLGHIDESKAKSYEEKLFNIISSNFKFIAKFNYETGTSRDFNELSAYERMQLVTDYVSGMTDSYAFNLYQELIGTKLP